LLAALAGTSCFFSFSLLCAGQLPLDGKPRYYDTFDPALSPWQPPQERNIEEVFKRHEYFSIQYGSEDGQLAVTRHLQGRQDRVTNWRLLDDGSLQPVQQQTAVRNRHATAEMLYTDHCANCHGAARLGGAGPALLPSNLGRLRPDAAAGVIRDGRPATQMPPYGKLLGDANISALVDFIYMPPATDIDWDETDISRLQQVMHEPGSLPDSPVYKADPLNIFLVVEAGDHYVTVLDGDALEPLHRFPTRFALHGGIKYSPDGRFAYLASRDGWISKFDLYSLQMVAEVRAGINTRNVAIAGDGRTLMVGNYLPNTLVLLDAEDLAPLKVIPVRDSEGKGSRVSAVYQAAPRDSYIAALKDVPEVWEIHYNSSQYPVRKIRLEQVLDDFFFDQGNRYLVGADRVQHSGQVVDLDHGRPVAVLPLSGMPHLGSGITWSYSGRTVFATPNLKDARVTVIDMQESNIIKEMETLGPGFFMRSHEQTPYAPGRTSSSVRHRDAMHVIDKRSLEIVKTLRPEPGMTSGHVEFTRDGRYALVSLWEMEGALVIYDAATLTEVKRITMRKPSGKYNVYNKINRSAGTSH
jgi:mono/diheme cytochrome c family protein/DNA-binding beta-propeller fold protein YncE